MENEIVYAAAAIICVALIIITRAVLRHYKGLEAEREFRKYEGIAVSAAKWAEERIPDDIGTDKDDPKWEKYLRRTDEFLNKFIEYHQKLTGKKPTPALIDEAKRFGSELAHRVSGAEVGKVVEEG